MVAHEASSLASVKDLAASATGLAAWAEGGSASSAKEDGEPLQTGGMTHSHGAVLQPGAYPPRVAAPQPASVLPYDVRLRSGEPRMSSDEHMAPEDPVEELMVDDDAYPRAEHGFHRMPASSLTAHPPTPASAWGQPTEDGRDPSASNQGPSEGLVDDQAPCLAYWHQDEEDRADGAAGKPTSGTAYDCHASTVGHYEDCLSGKAQAPSQVEAAGARCSLS